MKSRAGIICGLLYGLHALVFVTEFVGNSPTHARKAASNGRHRFSAGSRVGYTGQKPSLTRPLRDVTVQLGKTAVFRCEISGSPARIRWRKNNVYVPHTRRFRTRSYSWGGLLRIRRVRVSDYGSYSCKARNSLGRITSNKARLIIKGVNPLHTERCEVYTGKICSAHVSKTEKTFIKFGQTQSNVEHTIQDTFRRISSFLSPQCKTHFLPSLCKHYFQPCDTKVRKATPIPICKQDCVQLEQSTCKEIFTMAKAISVKLRHQLPICGALPTANGEDKPKNCQRIFTSETRQQVSHDSPNQNNAEILRTLLAIISGASQTSHTSQPPFAKSDPSPVVETVDDQEFRGKCEPYVGTVCSKYLPAKQKIFISENRTQQGFETKLSESLTLILPLTSSHCRSFALRALCYYFFPPCKNDDQTPKLICRRDCEVLEVRVCSKEFQYARTIPIAGEIIPDCSFLPEKQDACLKLGLPGEISDVLPETSECSIYAMSRRNQGKLIPIRPSALPNSSQWCKVKYQKTQLNLLPSTLREELEGFGQNSSLIVLGHSVNKKGISKYCVKLESQTPQSILNNSYLQTVTLPNMIRPDPDRVVPGMVFQFSKNKSHHVEMPLGFMSQYRPHKYVELNDVHFSYRISGSHKTFVGRGSYRLCGTNFSVEIKRTKYDFVRINGNSRDPVDVNTIEQVFGVADVSDKLLEILKKYGVFLLRLTKPSMEMYVGDTLSAKFSGMSYMEKFGKNARTEIIAGKLHNRYMLAAGLIFEDEPLGTIVSSFSGVYLKYLDMFQAKNGKSKIGLSLSARRVDVTKIPFMAYTSEPLASAFLTTIPRGLYVTARTGTPKNCKAHQTLCQLIQIVLGKDAEFTLTGQTDWQWAHFKASIQNTAIKTRLPVEKVEIEMKATNSTGMIFGLRPYLSYSVEGDVFVSKKKSNKLIFKGNLLYSGFGRQLTGRIKTNAVWKKAFGFPQLTIKQMQARFTIQTVKPYFPNKLVTKADFEVGLHCENDHKSDCITGTAFVGMSDERTEQYFHGVISRFTIQDILRVHGVRSTLPTPIGTIGFPEGLEITFAKQNHNLRPFGGPLIKPGFYMRGRIRVLGFESDCNVNLKSNEFIVDADINGKQGPIKLGGVTPLYRSRKDRKHGPKLYLETRFSPKPYVKAYIDGYTRIFGIFDEVRILMTRRHFMIRLVTRLFKSFKVRINVMANYSEDLSRTHFKARVVFLGGLAKLTRTSSKHVMAILRNERLKLQSAKNEANALRGECQAQAKKRCSNCMRSSTCKKKLFSCKSSLTARGRPSYSKNPPRHFCQRLLRDNCDFKPENCKFICRNSTAAHHPCKSFYQSQKTVMDLEKSSFWVHQVKLMFTSDLFRVHAITFETRLTPKDIGDLYVNARLNVTMFGQRQSIGGVRLKFGVFARLAADVARHAVEWFRKSQQ